MQTSRFYDMAQTLLDLPAEEREARLAEMGAAEAGSLRVTMALIQRLKSRAKPQGMGGVLPAAGLGVAVAALWVPLWWFIPPAPADLYDMVIAILTTGGSGFITYKVARQHLARAEDTSRGPVRGGLGEAS